MNQANQIAQVLTLLKKNGYAVSYSRCVNSGQGWEMWIATARSPHAAFRTQTTSLLDAVYDLLRQCAVRRSKGSSKTKPVADGMLSPLGSLDAPTNATES